MVRGFARTPQRHNAAASINLRASFHGAFIPLILRLRLHATLFSRSHRVCTGYVCFNSKQIASLISMRQTACGNPFESIFRSWVRARDMGTSFVPQIKFEHEVTRIDQKLALPARTNAESPAPPKVIVQWTLKLIEMHTARGAGSIPVSHQMTTKSATRKRTTSGTAAVGSLAK